MNCNLACSPAQAGSEQRPCPQGSLFPILAFPPLSLHTHTHTQNPTMTVGGSLEEPGRELQCVVLCSVSMRVYVNFLFYGGSSLHMYRSLFRCSVWEKKKKKGCVKFSWICNLYGKRHAVFLGNSSLSRRFTVQLQFCKSYNFYIIIQSTILEHYRPLISTDQLNEGQLGWALGCGHERNLNSSH